MDVCSFWTTGHGGGSGQNRLSSVLWSEVQTWGWGQGAMVVSQAPGVLAQAGPAPLSSCKAWKGALSSWAGVQSARASSLPGPIQGRTEPCVLTPPPSPAPPNTHTMPPAPTARPKEGKGQAHTLLCLVFLHPFAVVYAWVEGVLRRPYLQIVPPQIHDSCLPKRLPTVSPVGEKPASLPPFLSKGLLEGKGRQTRVDSV